MLCQSRTSAERDYNDRCAANARSARLAAEACNELLSLAQADFLLACVEQNPVDSIPLVESIFDEVGWPDTDLDENWLDDTGARVWKAYRMYRAIGTEGV